MIAHMKIDPHYLEVVAEVRYWEDATVDGVDDREGLLIPLREGDHWHPTIRLSDGQVMGWPAGTTAHVHYKVCDEGLYFLLNKEMQRIATREDHYVPDRYLCVGSQGYGDYIILNIGGGGKIEGWRGNPYPGDPNKDTGWIPA
jgi:hypothetical protein